jgi:hypothetical protein
MSFLAACSIGHFHFKCLQGEFALPSSGNLKRKRPSGKNNDQNLLVVFAGSSAEKRALQPTHAARARAGLSKNLAVIFSSHLDFSLNQVIVKRRACSILRRAPPLSAGETLRSDKDM